jgi:hypothetical protein
MPDVFCRSFNGIGISFAFCRRSAPRRVIVVFPHTFGRHLNFNCYLHMLVSEGGLEHFQFFRRLLGRMVLDRADHLLERNRLQHLQPTPLA